MSEQRFMLAQPGGEPEPCVARGLAEDDVDAVLCLHRHLVRDLPAELVATETRGFFADHAARCGRLVGVFSGSQLIAYAVLGLPGSGDPNFGVDHGLTGGALQRVAHLDGAGVDPRYRGLGLQRWLIRWRLDAARAAGRAIVLSTVAPRNAASLDNMIACGLTIRGLAVRYGGWRYLLRRDLDRSAAPVGAGRWIGCEEPGVQCAAFEGGEVGWKVRVTEEDRRELWCAALDERPEAGWEDRREAGSGPAACLHSVDSGRRPDSRQ